MFNVNSTNSQKLANSVQRDYHQAAENHRLLKESGSQPNHNMAIKIGLALTTLVTAALMISPSLV